MATAYPIPMTGLPAVVISHQQPTYQWQDFPWIPPHQIERGNLPDRSVLLIVEPDVATLHKSIAAIRQHDDPQIYLRPVIAVSPAANDLTIHGGDGQISAHQADLQKITQLVDSFQPLFNWLDSLPAVDEAGNSLALRCLRLIASRDQEVVPTSTVERITGFSYSLLEPLFSQIDQGLQQTLDYLTELNLLTARFITRTHQCVHCHSAFLNFKECCPHCSAEDLQVDELVHHFRCAHTAPLKDFQKNGEMICPKCDQPLRHIGVDYDKPSIHYSCGSCSHHFSNPQIMTTCFNCGRSAEPELQVQHTVEAYNVTTVGEHAARFGINNLISNVMSDHLQLLNSSAFRQVLDIEQSRIERYQRSESSILLLKIADLETIYLRVGSRAPELFNELAGVFKQVLRRSDAITSGNDGFFAALLTETSEENASRALERLSQGLNDLFIANMDHTPRLRSCITPIHKDLDFAGLLETFLSDST